VALPLSGAGVAPEGTAAFEVQPRSVSFGEQPVSAPSGPRQVVVTNSGDVPLTVSPVAVLGAPDFTISQAACPATLEPGVDCAATVVFTPVTAGERTAQLLFGGGAGPAVPLSGAGAEPENAAPEVSPRLLEFGEQLVGGVGPPLTVTVTNRANRPLQLRPGDATAATGSFRIDGAACTGTDVAPGAWCDVAVTFAPTVAGRHSGFLVLTAEGFPDAAVVLGGVGVDPRAPPVPDVIGKTLADARAELTRAGFVVGEVREVVHADIPAGSVSDQVPRARTPLAAGGTVDLVVSTGPEPVTVPDVARLTVAKAAQRLADDGLRVGASRSQVDPKIPEDEVIASEPAAGTKVDRGSAVDLIVSAGRKWPRVPDVVGLTHVQAEERLLGADLQEGTVTRRTDKSIPDGHVMASDPVAGTEVEPGTPVALVVSSGPPPVTVPPLVGVTQREAGARLQAAELATGDVTPRPDCSIPEGVVLASAPAAGADVKRGTAVDLTVSSGKPMSTVPAVVGRTEAEAEAALKNSGFTATVNGRADAKVQKGTVIATDPPAGSSASTCSPVTVTVSTGNPLIAVPQVVGLEHRAAESLILDSGFRVGGETRKPSCQVGAEVVISSSPEAGALREGGTPVDIVLSTGAPQALVPGVVGRPEAEARTLLQDAGFTVGQVAQAAHSTIPRGSVIASNPGAEATASTCTPVTLTVSTGPSKVRVPAVANMSEVDARRAVGAAGLEATVSRQSDPRVAEGMVISSVPAAGTEVDRGSTVNLTVSTGAITVPDLRGLTPEQATTKLTGLGLKVGTVEGGYDSDAEEGTVISSRPAAHTPVAAGSAVDLVVHSEAFG